MRALWDIWKHFAMCITASMLIDEVFFPADTRRWFIVILTLVHRLRRWTNGKPTLIQLLVSAGLLQVRRVTLPDLVVKAEHGVFRIFYIIQWTRGVESMSVQHWSGVVDGAPALNQHWFPVSAGVLSVENTAASELLAAIYMYGCECSVL